MTHYTEVCAHVEAVARACGRNPKEICVIAVSKNQSVEAIGDAYAVGCRNVGENRVQEALVKMAECAPDLRWHLIGSLQTNKVRKVIGRFACIHSVDDVALAQRISRCSAEVGVVTPILLQVNISGEATKQGLSMRAWREQMDEVLRLPALRVEGLMTMAPYRAEERVTRSCFSQLRAFRDELGLVHLSMGMSEDYPIAIQEGATLLRIGSAIFDGEAPLL